MKNKLIILITVIFLLNSTILNAENNEIAYYESIPDIEKTIKILFYSWGEDLTTTIDLDDYFPTRREENTQYFYISPPEIIVSIDQASGIATLKASKDWIGTKEIYFSLSDIYKSYEKQTKLQNYIQKIKIQRESQTIKSQISEFKDSSLYSYLDPLFNKLEKESPKEIPKITTNFENQHLDINVRDIDLNIGVQTRTKEGIKTYRPHLLINVKAEEKPVPTLEETPGYSIWILAPLFIILIVLAVMLYFYIKNNFSRIKKFTNKIIPTKKKTNIDILSQDIKKLKTFSREVKKLYNQINKTPLDKSTEKYFIIVKNFLNNLTHAGYEFTYSEINKEILEEDLDDELKEKLVKFSKDISDIRFSGKEIKKSDIKPLIKKTQDFISKAISSKQRTKIKEHTKLLKKEPLIHYINFIKFLFKKEESNLGKYLQKISKSSKAKTEKLKEKEKKITAKLIKRFLHNHFGLFKTEAEMERILQEKRKVKQERKKLELEKKKEHKKIEKKIIKITKRFLHDTLGLFKTKEEIEEALIRKKRLAKLKKERHRKRNLKKFLNKLGILKTEKERASIKRIEVKKKIRKNFSDHIHSFNFFKNLQKIFSPKIENTKINEIKLLTKKIEHQFKLQNPNNKKIIKHFLKANNIYHNLNKPSKSIISPELFKIKNKIGFIAVKSSLEKTKQALKSNQLKKAEELYNKLSRTYYELPLKEKEKLHEARSILQQKLKPAKKPLFKLPTLYKKISFKFPNFQKPKFEKEKIKEKLIRKTKPLKKEIEVRENILDYLKAKKPHFPSLQTFLTKKRSHNKHITQILRLIRSTHFHLTKKQHEKAREFYKKTISMFKELPHDLPSEIRDNIYHKLLPLKKQILGLSLHNSLQKTKKAVIKGKIKDAKNHHKTASKIYTHLATKQDIFIPGPITLKEKQLQKLINKIQNPINSKDFKKAQEIYKKISEIYNELPPIKKQLHYNKVSLTYHKIINKK